MGDDHHSTQSEEGSARGVFGGARWSHPELETWEASGRRIPVPGGEVFVVVQPRIGPGEDGELEPLLIVHGFPTSSFDFAHLVPSLARRRRSR